MSAIEVKNVSVIYGKGTPFEKTALDNVSIDFGSDRVVGIIGHTGSGKSTLAMLLNGLNKPTEGAVMLEGKDIWENSKEISKVRFRVGLVFQYPEHQLFEDSVYKDIAFGPKNMGMEGDALDKAVRDAAAFCGIGNFNGITVHKLVGKVGNVHADVISGVKACEGVLHCSS